ncbi:spore cortex biosynthesis protein YabQ [Salsuginibacillus halophilus]|uniref:Spore cortex biosynthesis protein YabQ n=1 Tax=Salsuginibacillus halophilus TaxID=517424 RepID=A0A2P8H7R4_9BACI|nr:spore cortex biosynthesis protein YabQ [Salsuginibacillus halophilus]PSL42263.1 spore cortex biosynthesis protein YabQ [Salsuginibacillus halophilus]
MTLEIQFQTMLVMAAAGVMVGAGIDIYQRLTPHERRFRWHRLVLDMLFWIVQGLFVFYILLQVNDGEMRVYVIGALLLGWVLYQKVLQSTVLRWLEFGIRLFNGCLRLIHNTLNLLLWRPLQFILQVIIDFVMIVVRTVARISTWIGRLLWRPFGKMFKKFTQNHPRFYSRLKRLAALPVDGWRRLQHWLKQGRD